jgi:hypothetical protein
MMDIENKGRLNLIDIRKGLLAIDFRMGDALKILKLFDLNGDG